jgi:DNA-binding NarL/FixJ family response regulator
MSRQLPRLVASLRGMPHPHNVAVQKYRHLLTYRENSILDCILSGWDNGEIADELDLTKAAIGQLCWGMRSKLPCPPGIHLRTWLQNIVTFSVDTQ